MRSDIIFFDSLENSKKGTSRALIIIFVLSIMWFIWYGVLMKQIYVKHINNNMHKSFNVIIQVFLCLFLISSSIGVHVPNTIKKSLVYGGLVGFVIFGVCNSVLIMTNNKWTYSLAVVDTFFNSVFISISAYVLYKISQVYPSVFNPV